MHVIGFDFSFTRLIFVVKLPLSGRRQSNQKELARDFPRADAHETRAGDSHG
jgi:hypothetical protein